MESSRLENKEVVYTGKKRRGERDRRSDSNDLKVAYTNVNGLISGLNELNDYLDKSRPDIMGIVETKLKGQIPPESVGNGLYKVWSRNRKDKQGGGVMLLIRDNLRVKKITYGKENVEMIMLKIESENKKNRDFIIMYVPPKTRSWNEREYMEMINNTKNSLKDVLQESENTIMMGDFNCKEVKWEEMSTEGGENSWGNMLLDITMEHTMTQWIGECTRYRNDEEPSRLDLIFTKEPEIVNSVEYKTPVGKSDHVLIEIKLDESVYVERNETHKIGRWMYNKTDFFGLKKFFSMADWKELYSEESGVEDKWYNLVKNYKEGVEKFVPRKKQERVYIKEWFNKRCSEAKERRDKAWNKWKKDKHSRNWDVYIRERNYYVKVRREEKRNFEKDVIDKCKEQPKLFYRYVNGKLKNKHDIGKLRKENIEYTEDQEMAEVMSDHFSEVFTRETNRNEETEQQRKSPPLRDIIVEREDIEQEIRNLDVRRAHGPDEISNWILKECKEELADKVYIIIKCSLIEGKLPEDWKKANVVPIYKGGNKEDPTNYRPVSLTSTIAKICEKVIKKRWVEHLEENKVLNPRQFGFRQGRSCTTNLLCFYSRLLDIIQERDGWADCVFLDLKKAFDKVPHKKLIEKLSIVGGLQGKLLEWMRDFLCERKMRVTIREKVSTWKEVMSGVPQGSVLAPIMFAIYVNDMDEGIDSYMNFFADDAKLLRKVKHSEDCEVLQKDLEKVWRWGKKWEMEFNIKKCSIMEFGRSKNRIIGTYKLGDEEVKKVEYEKDLGVVITNNMSPDKHINKVIGETYSLIRSIKVAFAYMDGEMVKKILVSMIRPKLEYAATLWSPSTKKNIKKLERIQRAVTKLAPELSDLPYEERLQRLELPTLEQRRERGDLLTVFRIMKDMEVLDREDLLKWETRNTRGHGRKLRKENCRRDLKKNSFPHRVVDVWNNLDKSVVCAKTIHEFKSKLDNARYGDGTPRA